MKDFEFKIDNKKVSIVKFKGSPKDVVIPEEIDGYPVTQILEKAFANCETLETINLPQSLEFIGKQAFISCTNLIKITLPPRVCHLGSSAFSHCTSLSEVTLSEDLEKINESTFFKCTNLSQVVFNKKLKIIDMYSFFLCQKLNFIFLPSSLVLIAKYSFINCTNLWSIIFLDEDSDELQNILIEKNAILYNESMSNLPEFLINSFNKEDKEKYYLKLIYLYYDTFPEYRETLINSWNNKDKYFIDLVFLKSTAEEISMYFNEGFHLDLLVLDEYLEHYIEQENATITAILLEYKNNNYSQEKIDVHEEEKELVEMGFKLPTLEQFKQKWVVNEYDDYITISGYKGKNNFEVIPETIDTGKPILYVAYSIISAFSQSNSGPYGNHNTLVYSNKTPIIPDEFKTLERVILANGDEIFVSENFKKSNLKEIIFPPDLKEVMHGILHDFKYLEKVALPNSIEAILSDTFSFCKSLKEINLPTELTTIKEAGFYRCESLQNIVFPDKLKNIDGCAFQDCHSLVEITLPESLEKLKRNTFLKCKSLKRVNLPDTLKDIDKEAFFECPALEFVGYSNGENILDALSYK